MRKKSGRKRPYFTVKSAMTAILRDASGKMHRGILFDRRLLSTLRQKFWRNQGRREVKRVIRRVACQKQRVGPCAWKMSPLPEERVDVHQLSHMLELISQDLSI